MLALIQDTEILSGSIDPLLGVFLAVFLMVMVPFALYLLGVKREEKTPTADKRPPMHIEAWEVVAQGPNASLRQIVQARTVIERLQHRITALEAELVNSDIRTKRFLFVEQEIAKIESFLEQETIIFDEFLGQLRDISDRFDQEDLEAVERIRMSIIDHTESARLGQESDDE